jgi:uncharacterized protein (DUF2147 family)
MLLTLHLILTLMAATLPAPDTAMQPSPLAGSWRTVDDETGQAKAIIRIVERDGRLDGRIETLLRPDAERYCGKCQGERRDKALVGMVILWDLRPDGAEWTGGQILDPATGKTYRARARLRKDGTLEVRGFLGVSLVGRTQLWHRVH